MLLCGMNVKQRFCHKTCVSNKFPPNHPAWIENSRRLSLHKVDRWAQHRWLVSFGTPVLVSSIRLSLFSLCFVIPFTNKINERSSDKLMEQRLWEVVVPLARLQHPHNDNLNLSISLYKAESLCSQCVGPADVNTRWSATETGKFCK